MGGVCRGDWVRRRGKWGYESVGEGVMFKRLYLFKSSSSPYIVTK